VALTDKRFLPLERFGSLLNTFTNQVATSGCYGNQIGQEVRSELFFMPDFFKMKNKEKIALTPINIL